MNMEVFTYSTGTVQTRGAGNVKAASFLSSMCLIHEVKHVSLLRQHLSTSVRVQV